jgi:hypothetical protein
MDTKIILIIITVIIIMLMLIAVWFFNKKPNCDPDYVYSSSKPNFVKLIPLSDKGPIPISSDIKHYINGGLYGEFEITEKKSKKLLVISEEYYEITIYSLPNWNIVYSETDIHELDLSFLNFGHYSLIIHSLEDIKAKLFTIPYEVVSVPKSKIYNSGTDYLYQSIPEIYDEVLELLSLDNILPSSENYSSNQYNKWPYMLRTKIEKLDILPPCQHIVVIGADRTTINIKADVDNIVPKLLLNKNGIIAYQLPGNVNYNFNQINENLADDAHNLPFYIYGFN